MFQGNLPIHTNSFGAVLLFYLIETPSHLQVQAETYLSYKSHNTAKRHIRIVPNGFITFISHFVPWRTSDVAIILESGLLDLVEAGDSIKADREFTI